MKNGKGTDTIVSGFKGKATSKKMTFEQGSKGVSYGGHLGKGIMGRGDTMSRDCWLIHRIG